MKSCRASEKVHAFLYEVPIQKVHCNELAYAVFTPTPPEVIEKKLKKNRMQKSMELFLSCQFYSGSRSMLIELAWV